MFNLLITHEARNRDYGVFRITKDRFLEYTSPSIADSLQGLSDDAINAICSWPCILMDEGRGDEEVLIGDIAKIEPERGSISVHFAPVHGAPNLINDSLWKIRNALDIQEFEFNRNHWSVKDRDLLKELLEAGFEIAPEIENRFINRPLPAPNRPELLAARDVIATLRHTEIDDLLLEAGVSSLQADRSVGSRKDRVNTIVKFIFENPAVTTAENRLFSVLFLDWAKQIDPDGKQGAMSAQAGGEEKMELSPNSSNKEPSRSKHPNRVFVVHGQNNETRDEVVCFLENAGLRPIVLHEQPNMGRHLLTKFVDEAELVTFAVVLLTDDDTGGKKGENWQPRARQNVILELGYFLAHLGQSRVCALKTPGVETPSDFDGIVYIAIEESERWKEELLREFRAAGMPVEERE